MGCDFSTTPPPARPFCPVCPPFRIPPLTYRRSVTLLESTLVEMPASVDSKLLTYTLKSFSCNIYKNPGGGGQLLLTRNRNGLLSLVPRHQDRRPETNVSAVRPNR